MSATSLGMKATGVPPASTRRLIGIALVLAVPRTVPLHAQSTNPRVDSVFG